MKKYESVIIINPKLNESEQKAIQNKYEKIINENGKLEKTDDLGIKNLAYEIKGNKKGYYVVFYFESEDNFISELERQYKIDDNIFKFIVIKREE